MNIETKVSDKRCLAQSGFTALLVACAACGNASSPAPDATGGASNAGGAFSAQAGAGGAPSPSQGGSAAQLPGAGSGAAGATAGQAGEPAQAGAAGASASGGASGSPAVSSAGASGATGGGSAGGAGGLGSAPYLCNLLLGVSATGEWFTPAFVGLMPSGTWQAITREHEYIEFWAGLDPDRVSPTAAVRSDIWAQPPTPSCSSGESKPERVVFVAFAETTNAKYNDYSNLADTTVRANWVTALDQVVSLIQSKYASVRRIELMTMIRGPGSSGPGKDCQAAASTNHEDIVEPWVDDAVATVVGKHPGLVAAAPKFYVDDCSWFNNGGPHFVTAGHPELVAKKVATYYLANP